MTRYGVDASTVLQLLDSGRTVDPRHQLVGPSFLRSEALQLLLESVRAGARTEQAALDVHERMTSLKVRLLGDRVSRGTAWRIAMQQGWSTLRDAEYLAVVRLQADALVTVDPHLANVATGIVATAPFESLFLDGERS
jgi:predicted nucleic acid-binding protein